MIADRFDFRITTGASYADERHHSPQDHYFDFDVTFNPDATFGFVDNVGSASASLDLGGIGNIVVSDATSTAAVSVHGGDGLSTVVLGNGDEHVSLQGAFNTVVLGDGNDVVNAEAATGSVVIHDGEVHVTYQNYLSATFASPFDVSGLHATSTNHVGIGYFNSGTGNIGAFNGLGNSNASDGNYNIGVFNGGGNGGTANGNGNIGAFNGNFNGLGNASPSDGNNNGNDNIGVLNGNYNGNLNAGYNSGNGNGSGNIGVDSGNLNGNGVPTVALRGDMHATEHLVGGFDTIVVGNGSDSITAFAGVSTIVAGNGNDQILIGGSYNTVVAGNGIDRVTGVNVDHASIALGNGDSIVNLTGQGFNVITTGSGNDVISLSGIDNCVDAGAATTFNTIFGGAGKDTFVLAQSGMDKIFNFNLLNGDHVDLQNVLAGTNWNGQSSDLSHFVSTEFAGGNTLLECTTASGGAATVAELMDTHYTLAMLEASHGLLA